VGDALQALAFELAAHPSCSDDPAIRAELAYHLAVAAGGRGMVLGQAEDIAAETADVPLDLAAITGLQGRKTGALFHWSATVGPRMAKADIAPLGRYADALGLAFQIADDILDVEGDSGKAGKRLQKDGAAGKATFVSLLGLDAAKRRAGDLVAEAQAALEVYGDEGDTLRQAAQFVIARDT
jgi:farnesyl diphosphate synthase